MKTSLQDLHSEIDKLNIEVDNAVEDLNPDALVALSDQLKTVTEEVKQIVNTEQTTVFQSIGDADHATVIRTAQGTLNDLYDLISISKSIANHLYQQLVTLDLNDPRLVEGAAAFITSTRESIADFIAIYRDEQAFLHKIQLMNLQFEQRKALLKYKAELDANKNMIDATADTVTYTQEDIINLLN